MVASNFSIRFSIRFVCVKQDTHTKTGQPQAFPSSFITNQENSQAIYSRLYQLDVFELLLVEGNHNHG
jgi:hypothetical protein